MIMINQTATNLETFRSMVEDAIDDTRHDRGCETPGSWSHARRASEVLADCAENPREGYYGVVAVYGRNIIVHDDYDNVVIECAKESAATELAEELEGIARYCGFTIKWSPTARELVA